jgi:hypothetical protein
MNSMSEQIINLADFRPKNPSEVAATEFKGLQECFVKTLRALGVDDEIARWALAEHQERIVQPLSAAMATMQVPPDDSSFALILNLGNELLLAISQMALFMTEEQREIAVRFRREALATGTNGA